MRRRLLRWCIHCWAEAAKPKWLCSAIKRDESLRVYAAELGSMESLLSRDAQAWADVSARGISDHGFVVNRSVYAREAADSGRRPAGYGMGAVGLAASVTLLAALWWVSSMQDKSRATQVASADLRQMNEGIRSLFGVFDESISEVQQAAALWPKLTGDAAIAATGDLDSVYLAAKGQFESSSRLYGKTLAFIQDNVRDQLTPKGGMENESGELQPETP